MAVTESSFDIISKPDPQEIKNAVQQAQREIETRFDFRNSMSEIAHDGKRSASPQSSMGSLPSRQASGARRGSRRGASRRIEKDAADNSIRAAMMGDDELDMPADVPKQILPERKIRNAMGRQHSSGRRVLCLNRLKAAAVADV